jgi:enoyl-CoA hydratase/carnithine racemase
MSDVSVRIESGIATVTLDRPAKRNAVTLGMWRELRRVFEACAADASVRVVVLTGAGGHFCAGADITEFDQVRSTVEEGAAYEHAVDSLTDAITGLMKPTIAAVSGFCVGGGCGLAMACDFRVADRTAQFGIPAARLGIVYGIPDCRNLMHLVGLASAKEILFTGRRFDAAEAYRIGFIDRLADDVKHEVAALAHTLAENAPLSIAGIKLVLQSLAAGHADRRSADVAAAMDRAMASEDYREAVRAFKEKRRPTFTGR